MKKIIGIVGGVGPYAGLVFNEKIFDLTPASADQDHLEVILISASAKIGDRTEYIFNPELPNPAEAIFKVILRLKQAGANLIAIPCNTAHSPPIMEVIQERIKEANLQVMLVHMIEETFNHLKANNVSRVGLLATKGTYRSQVYNAIAGKNNIELLIPDSKTIEKVHQSIYDTDFGIKAKSNPVSNQAIEILKSSAEKLIVNGAQTVIMGCTEIPIALKKVNLSVPLLDPMDITAQILVHLALST